MHTAKTNRLKYLKMAILQMVDAYEELSKVYKTYIGRKIELVFNLFDSIFFDSSFQIQGCKCEQLMRYLNFQHQFLRCHRILTQSLCRQFMTDIQYHGLQ